MSWYVLLPIVAFISIAIRVLPFLAGGALQKLSFLPKLSSMLPGCLLVMITAYTLHDVDFKGAPFGLPEVGALLAVACAQILFRKITISMLIGVICNQCLRMILLTS